MQYEIGYLGNDAGFDGIVFGQSLVTQRDRYFTIGTEADLAGSRALDPKYLW